MTSWDDCYRDCFNYFWVVGDTRANRIGVRIEEGREAFRLSTSGPVRSDLSGDTCERLAPGRWRCPHPVAHNMTLDIDGSSGGDRIRVRDAFPESTYLDGDGGRDKLIAAASDDHLNGGNGNDVERGGKGDDQLGSSDDHYRDYGRDAFHGGAGDDVIRAGDYGRDRRIRCGRGEDTAYVDQDVDPRPRGCEHIRYGL